MNNHPISVATHGRGRRRSSSRSSGSGPSSFTSFTARRHTNASTTSSDRSRLSSRRHSNASTNASTNANVHVNASPRPDVARLLDPAYAPSWHHRSRSVGHEFSSSYTGATIGRIQEQVRAYVDEDGELHDPDYRVFPVFPPRVRPMGLSNYSHGYGGRTNPSLMATTMPRRHTVSGQPTTRTTAKTTATTRNLWAERPTARERWASAIVDSDEDDDELNRDSGRGRADSVASYAYSYDRTSNYTRSRSHTPACSLSRTTSTRSSVHTAASYMYRDVASVVSAPATLHGTDHEMDFIESVGEMEVEDDDFVTSTNLNSDAADAVLTDGETCSSGGKWSFLHRMMRTPASSQPQSQSTSPVATPATNTLDVPRESPRGRSRSRNRSGSVLSCLPLSGSTSVSLTPPTSPHSHSHSHSDNAKHGVEETLVAHEERESTKQADEDVEVMYLDQQSGVAGEYYVSPTTTTTTTFMCRPVRAVNLRVRTRLWRVSKRMAESRGKLCAWIHTRLRRGPCKEKTAQDQQ